MHISWWTKNDIDSLNLFQIKRKITKLIVKIVENYVKQWNKIKYKTRNRKKII